MSTVTAGFNILRTSVWPTALTSAESTSAARARAPAVLERAAGTAADPAPSPAKDPPASLLPVLRSRAWDAWQFPGAARRRKLPAAGFFFPRPEPGRGPEAAGSIPECGDRETGFVLRAHTLPSRYPS